MATIIRQEINILDSILSAASGNSATSNEIVQLDTTKYTNPTYYFEIVADTSISLATSVTLSGATDGTLATCTVPLLTTSFTRIRSSSFTPTTATQDCTVVIANTVGATKNVKSAKIIVVDNPTNLLQTETQIEIGNSEAAKSNTAILPLNSPKFWTYTAANWNGIKTFNAEVVSKTSSTNTHTVRLEEDDGSFGTWATKTTIVNAVSGTTITRRRSVAFTPTDGRHYRISALSSTTKSTYTIYRAGIIVDQTGTVASGSPSASTTGDVGSQFIQGATGDTQSQAQSFVANSSSIKGIALRIARVLSPTDNILIDITSTLGGSSLGTSQKVVGSTLTTGNNWREFIFVTPITVTIGNTYYIQVTRDGARDTTNYYQWDLHSDDYANGQAYTNNSGTWDSTTFAAFDFRFSVNNPIVFLEPQYMLLNTLSAGTSLLLFQTLYDTTAGTEWDSNSGTITFKHAFEGTALGTVELVDIDNSNSVVTTSLGTLTGGTLAGGTQVILGSMTMPTAGHQIDTLNLGPTAAFTASRMLALVNIGTGVAAGGGTVGGPAFMSWMSLSGIGQ